MSWHHIQGEWHAFKGSIRQRWGEMTGEDVDKLEGAREEELSGRIQELYNVSKAEADRQVKEWIEMEMASRKSMDEDANPISPI